MFFSKIKRAKKNIENKLAKKLVMTLLVKNEDDVIEENIKFHLANGVDFIIATNNNSTDGTRNILLKYQELGKLELIDETADNFNQVAWVNKMIEIAKNKYKADWIMNIDADEFWYSRHGNLKLSLPENKNINAMIVSTIFINPQPAGEIFKIRPNMKGLVAAHFKVLHTAKGYKMISAGNHSVRLKFGHRQMIATNDIFIFHFWNRSIEQYERKIINTFKSIENGVKQGVLDNSFGSHIREHYELYKQGKRAEIYDSMVNANGYNYLIDNRLYDFINNGYKNSEQLLALQSFVNNYPYKSLVKYKLDKIILSCKRRKNEICDYFKKNKI